MTAQPLDRAKRPWWVRYPERYHAEADRFQHKFDAVSPFRLLNHPDSEKDRKVPSYAKGKVAWRGSIRVEVWDNLAQVTKGGEFLVDFVYPNLYPLEKIKVYPFYSYPQIWGARHQDPKDGHLCYMREQPSDWTPGTTNLEVLEKVRDWFEGYLTDWRLGKHVELPEPALYSPVKASDMTVFILENGYTGTDGYGDMEVQCSTNRSVLSSLRNSATNEHIGLEESLTQVKDHLLEAKITPVKGLWYDLEIAPAKQLSIIGLINFIVKYQSLSGALNRNQIVEQIARHAKPGAATYLGLRYKYGDKRQWVIFRVEWEMSGYKRKDWKRFTGEDKLRLSQVVNVPVYPIRPIDIFRRLEGVIDRQRLGDKKVLFVGVGAIGSPAALLLCKAGVGSFEIFDGDSFQSGNLVRHACGTMHLGMMKSDAVRDVLVASNPYVSVDTHHHVMDRAELADAASKADLVIAATGDENLDLLVNQVSVELGKPALYVRAMRKMTIARIMRVIPGQDACLSCLCGQDKEDIHDIKGEPFIDVPETNDDVIYDEGCGFPTVPGASVDTEQAAGLLARIAIDQLQGIESTANHWVWVGRSVDESDDPKLNDDLCCQLQTFLPVGGCEECGAKIIVSIPTDKPIDKPDGASNWEKISINSKVIKAMTEECAGVGELETGGILLGHIVDKTLAITHATGPGPNAMHRRHGFLRDTNYCQAELDRIFSETNGTSDYIGEWHKHADTGTSLSPTDIASLIKIARSSHYEISQPLMLICEMPDYRHPEMFQLRAFTWNEDSSTVQEVATAVNADDKCKSVSGTLRQQRVRIRQESRLVSFIDRILQRHR